MQNFKLLACFYDCLGRFVSDLFGNHIVGFSTRRLKRLAYIYLHSYFFCGQIKVCELYYLTIQIYLTHQEIRISETRFQKYLLLHCSACLVIFRDLFYYMSHCIRRPTKCLGENKGADQLCGNREADQRLCFRYADSITTLLLKSEISSF